jgi:hypothetical protein
MPHANYGDAMATRRTYYRESDCVRSLTEIRLEQQRLSRQTKHRSGASERKGESVESCYNGAETLIRENAV